MSTTTSTTEARRALSELVNRAAFGHERTTLERHGREIAAIVPIDDLRLLEALENELDIQSVREALADPANRERIAWDRVKAELGL